MVTVSGQFINDPSAGGISGQSEPIPHEEFQSAVDGGFGQTGEFLEGQPVDLGRREMPAGMPQDMQDGQTLGCHAETALMEAGGEF
jgi:hypothetical protein